MIVAGHVTKTLHGCKPWHIQSVIIWNVHYLLVLLPFESPDRVCHCFQIVSITFKPERERRCWGWDRWLREGTSQPTSHPTTIPQFLTNLLRTSASLYRRPFSITYYEFKSIASVVVEAGVVFPDHHYHSMWGDIRAIPNRTGLGGKITKVGGKITPAILLR